jgi:hypothetical protein
MNVDGSVVSHPARGTLMLNFKNLKQFIQARASHVEDFLLPQTNLRTGTLEQ